MYKNILIAVHGEEKENFNIELAEIIKFMKPKVTIIHVSETGLTHYGYVDQLASAITKDQFIEYIQDMANTKKKEIFDFFSNLTNTMQIDMEWKEGEGKPSEIVANEIRQGNYDLLILGTKSLSPGNTSSKVKEKMVSDLKTSLLIIK